jgi:hypothetical protein
VYEISKLERFQILTAARMNIAAGLLRHDLTVEAAGTSEISVNFYHTTRRNSRQRSHLHQQTSF